MSTEPFERGGRVGSGGSLTGKERSLNPLNNGDRLIGPVLLTKATDAPIESMEASMNGDDGDGGATSDGVSCGKTPRLPGTEGTVAGSGLSTCSIES